MVLSMVTSNTFIAVFSRRSPSSRALSLLLLVLIVYATTVEAAHKHGEILGTNQSVEKTLSNSGTARTLGLDLVGCGDCLICQLHQNFSTSLISIRLGITASTLRAQYSETAPVDFHSQVNAPRTGRAPPVPFLYY
jgi:hypothetical protein